jgi:ATP-dependent helicase HrpB
MQTNLPIEDVLPELKEVLRSSTSAVLQAPTGAGKTTRVPLALLEEPWLNDRRILMLEPRRLAARAAAYRMANMLDEQAGETVGYRVRMDTRVSHQTRIEVITEGVLTRMLQEDPGLEGVGMVVFDEFHERNLQADLGLALTLQSREILREDLRLLVMSATLDMGPVAELLDHAPMITSEGRSYPVETHYLDRQPQDRIEPYVVKAIHRALEEETGDILVFLPGAGEIRRVRNELQSDTLGEGVNVHPLYGNLSHDKQDRAIEPSPPDRRKIVLSTPIAETSLTIEGIRVVVDSGLMRVPRFSSRSGMTQLATVKVSKASADQRRGRAGRTEPGVCYRLWTRHTQQHLHAHTDPEIAKADLAPVALELAQWGTPDPSELRWLDPPPEDTYNQARALLRRLDAIDEEGQITDHGRKMAGLGLHPRLAHMLLRGKRLGLGNIACELAALLSERDIFSGQGEPPDADLRLRLEALRDVREGRQPRELRSYRVKHGAARRVLRVARHWKRRLNLSERHEALDACGLLLAFAYPDRIAQRAGNAGRDSRGSQFRMQNGQMVSFSRPQLLSEEEYVVAGHVGGRHRGTTRIFLAAPITEQELREHFSHQIEEEHRLTWDSEAGLVRTRRRERLGALILSDAPLREPDPTAVAETMIEGIREEGLNLLPWTKNSRQLQQRIQFMHERVDGWPDVSDEALLDSLEDWLMPHVYDMKRADELQRLHLTELLKSMLSWKQRDRLDEMAPTHITVPSGSRRPIDYSDPGAPALAVRLQELFGLTQTPRIGGGRVPLTLHLLSPAQRPVQITQDLANFWENTYYEVKKDMKGRYPKHYWPDDPLSATPTSRVRPEE